MKAQKQNLKPLNKAQKTNLQMCIDYLKTPGVKLGRHSYEIVNEAGKDVPNCAMGHFAINVLKRKPAALADNSMKILGIDARIIEDCNDSASDKRRKRSVRKLLEWHLNNR